LERDYPYYGNVEPHADTHVTLDEQNFRKPTYEEIEEILTTTGEIERAASFYGPVSLRHQAWDVYGPKTDEETGDVYQDEWLDTVFYDAGCDSDYVRRSLIGHDGFPDTITLKAS
jgi:hypothetical protein